MKIGIITFHFAHNYGAMLQAYAMQQQLISMGHNAYIIDYAPEYHKKWFRSKISWRGCLSRKITHTAKALTNKLINGSAFSVRYIAFDSFRKTKFKLYPYSSNDDMSSFDAVLLGSDQIWNIGLTNNRFDGPYYGDGFKCKVFSYAASAMYRELSPEQQEMFKTKLGKLSSVGVRETNLLNLLQPLTDKHIYLNLDPTLLAGAEAYSKLDLSRPVNEKYVLTYELQPHKHTIDIACNYAKHYGCKVISLTGNIFYNTHRGYDLTASPEKFIAYIKNAECVFTTSFHGAAISLVFGKQLYSIKQNDARDDRLTSIYNQLGLSDHFIESSKRPTNSNIDYAKVNVLLNRLRYDSIHYLTEAINN